MFGKNQIELWLGKSDKIQQQMKALIVSEDSARDYFLKTILSKYIPGFLLKDLVYNDHGKPYYKNSEISFNLSHCNKDLALIITKEDKCGIDIQSVEKLSKFHNALKSVLTDSEFSWIKQNGTEESFFQLWSLKEAFIKSIGSSIWFGRDYDFTSILADYTDKWTFENEMYLYSTEIHRLTYLSIAISFEPKEIVFRKI